METEFRPIRLACSHGPDLWFDGKLVGEYSTQNQAGTKSRWTELRLWETPAGNWIAESVGCSTRENEGEIREARVIEALVEIPLSPYPLMVDRAGNAVLPSPAEIAAAKVVERNASADPRHTAAMDAWDWTTAAKALARKLGWDVVRRVD